ncbi:MAG TPA: tetratricopeptide repeat protein, partial [Terriglobales bacterium]|nr:tetratricopeptide repeat protein [Terriglobales bacterium]
GDPTGQTNLASMYFTGRGVRRDLQEAAFWFHAAAERGVPEAQNNLAVLYYTGAGVPRDYAESARWVRRAADQGYVAAQADLGYLYEQGKGVPLDCIAAYMWYSLAATRGDQRSVARMKSIAHRMPPEQLKAARTRSAAWVPRPGKLAGLPGNEQSGAGSQHSKEPGTICGDP